MNATFSDLGNVAVNYLRKDANFLSIGNTQGSGTTERNTHVNASLRGERFLPNWGFQIPVSYDWLDRTGTPKFVPGSDVRYNAALSKRAISRSGSRNISLSMSRAGSRRGILRYTLDALTWNASMQDQRNLSTTLLDSSRTINGALNYRVSALPTKSGGQGQLLLPPIPIGRFLGVAFPRLRTSTLRVLPTSVTVGVSGLSSSRVSRSRDAAADTLGPARSSYSKTARMNANFEFSPFDDLPRLSLGMTSDRDIVTPEGHSIPILGNTGREIGSTRSFNVSYDPGWLNVFNVRADFNSSSQLDARQSLRLSTDSPSDRVVAVANNQGFSLSGSIPLQVIFARPNLRRLTPPPVKVQRDSTSSDSTAAKPKEPGIGAMTRMRLLLTNVVTFTTLNVRHNDDRSSRYSRVNGVPGAAYRYGFTRSLPDDIELLDGAQVALRVAKRDQVSTTATVLQTFRLDLSYSRDTDNAFTDGLGYPSRVTTWPNIRGSIIGLDKRFGLNKKITSLQIDGSYSRTSNVRFKANGIDKQSDALSSQWSPLFRVRANWRSGLVTTVSSERSTSSQLNTFTETGEQRSVDKTRKHSLDLTKTFSPSGGLRFPFLKPIKLRNPLSTSMNFEWRESLSQYEATGQPPVTESKLHSWTLTSTAGYTVGRDINSSFRFVMQRRYNDKQALENRRVEVSFALTYLFQ